MLSLLGASCHCWEGGVVLVGGNVVLIGEHVILIPRVLSFSGIACPCWRNVVLIYGVLSLLYDVVLIEEYCPY